MTKVSALEAFVTSFDQGTGAFVLQTTDMNLKGTTATVTYTATYDYHSGVSKQLSFQVSFEDICDTMLAPEAPDVNPFAPFNKQFNLANGSVPQPFTWGSLTELA